MFKISVMIFVLFFTLNCINVCVSFCLHQVALLGLDLLSALVTRLQERFRAQVGTGKTQISIFDANLMFYLMLDF